jgi:ubiquinone/menaquinone biosynthesis C-methylase UbiE
MIDTVKENSLYEHPDLYDLMAPRDHALERFYLETASERGGSVLDLACGTGRLTIPLAQAGLQVVGGDVSADMLSRARYHADRQAVAVEFVKLDIRDFDLNGRTFDTVIVAVNSVAHLQSLDDFKGFFRSVARHLSLKGRLVFDAFIPKVAMLGRDPKQRQLVGVATHETLGDVTVEEVLVRYDPLTQINHIHWHWSTREKQNFLKSSLQMRSIFPQEMPLLIASGGLRLERRFGDFDRSPMTSESPRQVCVCQPNEE